jgi:hypothetical protein
MLVANVAPLIEYTLLAWFAGVGLLIGWRLLSGSIVLTGLINQEPEGSFGFNRAQMLAVTLLFAAGYVVAALGETPGHDMPDISPVLIAALFGSHAAYLGGKYYTYRGETG